MRRQARSGAEAAKLAGEGMLGIHSAEVVIGVFIGAVTFTGSIVANLKLSARINSAPMMLPGKNFLNVGALVAFAALTVWLSTYTAPSAGSVSVAVGGVVSRTVTCTVSLAVSPALFDTVSVMVLVPGGQVKVATTLDAAPHAPLQANVSGLAAGSEPA